MIYKRTVFFGKLMPKEPSDSILVKNYHNANNAFDKYPNRRQDIVSFENNCAVCSNGDRLSLDT